MAAQSRAGVQREQRRGEETRRSWAAAIFVPEHIDEPSAIARTGRTRGDRGGGNLQVRTQHLKPVQLKVEECLAIIFAGSAEEPAPEVGHFFQPRTYFPVMMRGDLPHLSQPKAGHDV